MKSMLINSQVVLNESLWILGENSIAMQRKTSEMMYEFVRGQKASNVLADIKVYNSTGMKLENRVLQVEKAAEVTNMNPSEITFMKSNGTPHKILK